MKFSNTKLVWSLIPRKVDDIQEVVNYRKTLSLASEALSKGPIDLRLILQMHNVLMDSVRGSRKSPGQFRDRTKLDRLRRIAPLRQRSLFRRRRLTCGITWKPSSTTWPVTTSIR